MPLLEQVAGANLRSPLYRYLAIVMRGFWDAVKQPEPKVGRRHSTEEQSTSKSISYSYGKNPSRMLTHC